MCGKLQIVRKKCEKRLVVRICAGNGLWCEYVREVAKSAIPHPTHKIAASGTMVKREAIHPQQNMLILDILPKLLYHLFLYFAKQYRKRKTMTLTTFYFLFHLTFVGPEIINNVTFLAIGPNVPPDNVLTK